MRLLLLPAIGFLLFIVGTMVPLYLAEFRFALLACGVTMTLVFYFITLTDTIKAFLQDPAVNTFWLVTIICVPVIGNVIYVIITEMGNRWQQPHGVW